MIISLKILSDSHETKTDAVAVVNLLFDEMANLLANGNKVKIRVCAHFTSSNTKHTPARTLRQEKKIQVKPKKLPLSNAGRN